MAKVLSLNNSNAYVISLLEQYLILNVGTVLNNLKLLSINQLYERKLQSSCSNTIF